MDVTHVSHDKRPSLDAAKVSQSPLHHARWGDALNAAAAAREKSHAPRDANHATLSVAQKSRAHPTLNDKTGVAHVAHKALNDAHAATKSRVEMPQVAHTKSTPEPDALQHKAQTLVNQFFVGSMLKQMRESPFKTETFAGGKAGDAYAGMFDQHLAEHAGDRMAKGLVRSMVRRYQKDATKTPPLATA